VLIARHEKRTLQRSGEDLSSFSELELGAAGAIICIVKSPYTTAFAALRPHLIMTGDIAAGHSADGSTPEGSAILLNVC
jgi:hypothetical protein